MWIVRHCSESRSSNRNIRGLFVKAASGSCCGCVGFALYVFVWLRWCCVYACGMRAVCVLVVCVLAVCVFAVCVPVVCVPVVCPCCCVCVLITFFWFALTRCSPNIPQCNVPLRQPQRSYDGHGWMTRHTQIRRTPLDRLGSHRLGSPLGGSLYRKTRGSSYRSSYRRCHLELPCADIRFRDLYLVLPERRLCEVFRTAFVPISAFTFHVPRNRRTPNPLEVNTTFDHIALE
jgi:hypothetical protein